MAISQLAAARGSAQALLDQMASQWDLQQGLGVCCAYAIRTGGKRLRPTIAIVLGRMLQRSESKEGLQDEALCRAAVGVELLHLASLIADDLPCMDDDDERRGQPTVHRAFSESSALLASYALIAHGYELLTSAALSAPSPHRAIEAVSRIARCGGLDGACEGQFLDLELSAGRPADRRRMLELKTGALFEMAFLCGWGFGGSSHVGASELRELAAHFGLAFQLLDDLIDATKDGAENCVRGWGADRVLGLAQHNLQRFQGRLDEWGWNQEGMAELSLWLESSLRRVAQTSAVSASAGMSPG
jgi:geranylgeranyl diphosphate synthase type II